MNIDTAKLCQPIWNSSIVYYEAAVFDEKHKSLRLIYPADEILEVCSGDFKKIYIKNKDYRLENGAVVFTEASDIPIASGDTVIIDNKVEHTDVITDKILGEANYYYLNDHEGLRLIYDNEYLERCVLITYRHSLCYKDGYLNTPVSYYGSGLGKFAERLHAGKHINYLIYGDSAMCGASASGAEVNYCLYNNECELMASKQGLGGKVPPMFELFADEMKRKYGSDYTIFNISQGGKTSLWGEKSIKERINIKGCFENGIPDVAIIGFFANDFGSQKFTEVGYYESIKFIVKFLKSEFEDISIILLTGYPCNDRCVRYNNPKRETEISNSLKKISNEFDDIMCIDTLGALRNMLSGKRQCEYLSNNINHGGDFMQCLWAQTVCACFDNKD